MPESPSHGAWNPAGLRKMLRKWRDRVKKDFDSTSSTPASTRPSTPPVPSMLFTPTTQTTISSPLDPRNCPPNKNKRLSKARRNTATSDYWVAGSSKCGSRSASRCSVAMGTGDGNERDMSTTRNAAPSKGASRNASPDERSSTMNSTISRSTMTADSHTVPMNTVTTTITATSPQALRKQRSRLRLSFSRNEPPVVMKTRSRAPSASSNRAQHPTHGRSDSKHIPLVCVLSSTLEKEAPSDVNTDGTPEPASRPPGNDTQQFTQWRDSNSNPSNDKENLISAAEKNRRDELKLFTSNQSKDQEKDETKKDRRIKDEAILQQTGNTQLGTTV